MRSFSVFGGALGGVAALGIGRLIPAIRALPPWLRFPSSLLAGFSIAVFSTVLALTCGAGPKSLRALSLILVGIGIVGLAMAPPVMRLPKWSVAGVFLFAGLVLTVLPALAPSSKADEIRYHMLVPQRIIQDGGLQPYREPWEAAIYPQMGYQMTESLAWAWGLQEAPNLWSWLMTVAIAMLIAGSAKQLSNNTELALFAAAVAVLSLHPSVNLITAGSQAFGDMAMLIAVILALFPEDLVAVAPSTRILLVSVATCAVAISKISVMPISLVILALAFVRGSSAVGYLKCVLIPLSIWAIGYMPLVVWSFLQTGSPFGIATAGLFHSGFFGQATIGKLVARQHLYRFARPSLFSIKAAIIESGAYILACIPALLIVRRMRAVLVISAIQFALVMTFLPKGQRFMGGLQLTVRIVGVSALVRFNGRHIRLVMTVVCLMLMAVLAKYTIVYSRVALGIETDSHFLARTVPLMDDFPKLDRILPPDAILYAPAGDFPSIYSPRPVVFSRDDIRNDRPVFLISESRRHLSAVDGCADLAYTNNHAVIAAFRTREPVRGLLRVTRCTFER